jgi:transcription initiation factor TFIIIB Brf1 subunit/transcription initiation factor TFIIB
LKSHQCEETIIYPEGITGEKICSICGIVIDETPTLQNYTRWAPEWYSNWSEDDSETLKEWLTILRSVSCQLNIPNFPYREEVARTIRTNNRIIFKSQKLSKNKRVTIAALIHLILKEYDKMRPLKQISQELSIDSRIVIKQSWLLNKTLSNNEKRPIKIPRKTSLSYLHEYASKLTEDKELIQNAEQMLLKVKKAGGNPLGIAAGAFYNACKKRKAQISKEKIGEAFHISGRTVYTNEARIRKLAKATTSSIVL